MILHGRLIWRTVSIRSLLFPSDSDIPTVYACFRILFQRKPVNKFFDIPIPEVPLMSARSFFAGHLRAGCPQKIPELSVCFQQGIFRTACQIHFRQFRMFVCQFFYKPFRIFIAFLHFCQISENAFRKVPPSFLIWISLKLVMKMFCFLPSPFLNQYNIRHGKKTVENMTYHSVQPELQVTP